VHAWGPTRGQAPRPGIPSLVVSPLATPVGRTCGWAVIAAAAAAFP
jgi:hypothetical protein